MKLLNKLFLLLISVIFLLAATHKISNLSQFYISLKNYQIFTDNISRFFVFWVPSIELILGIFLLFEIKIKSAIEITIYLLTSFTILLLYTFISGSQIDCGCFGNSVLGSNNTKMAIGRNLVLLSICIYLLKVNKSKSQKKSNGTTQS